MKKLQTLLLAITFLLTSLSLTANAADAPPPGQIGVAPSMLEVNVGSKPVSESLRLFNLKNTTTKVKVEVYNWTLDENNEVKLLPPDEQSLDQWMLVNPLSFTLEPGKSQVVRLSIRPPVKPAPGEHRAIIYFTEEPVAADESEEAKPVEVLFKLGVGVYAYADDVQRASSIQTIGLDNKLLTLTTSIANKGNVHTRLKGNYSIWKKESFPGMANVEKSIKEAENNKSVKGLVAAGKLNQTPVLPGNVRSITTRLPAIAEKGNYIVAVSGMLDDENVEKFFTLSR